MIELGDALREALQGKSGADAMRALFMTAQSYIAAHPGRYSAPTGAQFQGDKDPLLIATTRVIDSIRAVVSGYGIRRGELDHAIRMLRFMIEGYAQLLAANGFQWGNNPKRA